MNNIINWHKSLVESVQKELKISNYGLYWYGFLDGVLLMWIVIKVIPFFFDRSTPDFSF